MSIFNGFFLNISAKIRQALPVQPCLLCGSFSHNGAWCNACDATLPYLTLPHCPICALPTLNGEICGRCIKRRPEFNRTLAVFAYTFPLDKLVQALKFGERLMLVHGLAESLMRHVKYRPDYIVAMPLHRSRLRGRGFNQSQELARHIARRLNIPLLAHACQRVRDTPPQSSLKWKERSKNMRNAFICSLDLSGKHVAVVDDVMTSGTSLNEVSIALRNAGASEISAWVIARTLPHTEQKIPRTDLNLLN